MEGDNMLRIVSYKVQDEQGRCKEVDYNGLKELLSSCQFDNATMTNGSIRLKKGTAGADYSVSMGAYKFSVQKEGQALTLLETTVGASSKNLITGIDDIEDIVKAKGLLVIPMTVLHDGITFAVCTSNGTELFGCSCTLKVDQAHRIKLKSSAFTGTPGVIDFIYQDATGNMNKFRLNRYGFPKIRRIEN